MLYHWTTAPPPIILCLGSFKDWLLLVTRCQARSTLDLIWEIPSYVFYLYLLCLFMCCFFLLYLKNKKERKKIQPWLFFPPLFSTLFTAAQGNLLKTDTFQNLSKIHIINVCSESQLRWTGLSPGQPQNHQESWVRNASNGDQSCLMSWLLYSLSRTWETFINLRISGEMLWVKQQE